MYEIYLNVTSFILFPKPHGAKYKFYFFFSFKYFLVSDWLQFPGEKMVFTVMQRRNS